MPNLPIPTHDEALDRQRLRTHRTVRMQTRRRDTDLRAETEFTTVTEARGRVDHDDGRADGTNECFRACQVARSNHFGVVRAVATNVRDRLIQAPDNTYRDDEVEELGGVVVIAGRRNAGDRGTCCLVAANFNIQLAEPGDRARQEA